MRSTWIAMLMVGLSTWHAQAATPPRVPYAAPRGTCAGWPRLDIGTLRGMCAGLVIGPTANDRKRPIMLPRALVQLDDTTWLVTDLGGWDRPRGAVFKLVTDASGHAQATPLLTKLNLPHALAIGPDGLAYVGEMRRIFRFDPRAADPAKTIEVVVDGLPDNTLHANRHPLSKFVFAPDGALLVNVGAPSDVCVDAQGRAVGDACNESESGEQAASLRRYARVAPGQWDKDYTVYAHGLRNSVALAVHASGTVLQGENSYDFPDRWHPFDEVNVIRAGKHYGWPYCADIATPTPPWKATRARWCRSDAHTAPALLLPPHAAPLDMLWYDGAMFPLLRGRLLMTWHGHRSVGGRIASYAVDAKGVPIPDRNARYPIGGGARRAYGAQPAADAVVLTPQWERVPGKRPQGSPVGLAVAKDGAIWVTDDRAGVVIRFARDD